MGKLLPIPDVSNRKFPEARIHEEKGLHRVLFKFSPADYTRAGEIWNGPHPEDGSELEFRDEIPEGAPWPDLDEEPQLSSPGVDPEMLSFFAQKLGADMPEEATSMGGMRSSGRAREGRGMKSVAATARAGVGRGLKRRRE